MQDPAPWCPGCLNHLSQGFFHGFAPPSGGSGLSRGRLGKGPTGEAANVAAGSTSDSSWEFCFGCGSPATIGAPGSTGVTAVVFARVGPLVALAAIRSASVRLARRTAAAKPGCSGVMVIRLWWWGLSGRREGMVPRPSRYCL
jgi:hypothetical protein